MKIFMVVAIALAIGVSTFVADAAEWGLWFLELPARGLIVVLTGLQSVLGFAGFFETLKEIIGACAYLFGALFYLISLYRLLRPAKGQNSPKALPKPKATPKANKPRATPKKRPKSRM